MALFERWSELRVRFLSRYLGSAKTKEMDGALTNNMEEYRTQKKAREKRLMAYAEEIQKNTLQMSSALIAELVAERKYQKKTQQDIADITGILPANIARFENGSRVPTLVVLPIMVFCFLMSWQSFPEKHWMHFVSLLKIRKYLLPE